MAPPVSSSFRASTIVNVPLTTIKLTIFVALSNRFELFDDAVARVTDGVFPSIRVGGENGIHVF